MQCSESHSLTMSREHCVNVTFFLSLNNGKSGVRYLEISVGIDSNCTIPLSKLKRCHGFFSDDVGLILQEVNDFCLQEYQRIRNFQLCLSLFWIGRRNSRRVCSFKIGKRNQELTWKCSDKRQIMASTLNRRGRYWMLSGSGRVQFLIRSNTPPHLCWFRSRSRRIPVLWYDLAYFPYFWGLFLA